MKGGGKVRAHARGRGRYSLSFLLVTLFAGCGARAKPQLSGVLITLDTTNRDALGCYGQTLPLTPNLDRLAAESLVFDQARTVAPLTLPAHASMLTGLVPLRHGVRDNALWPLPEAAETLAERARAAGFECAAFVSAVVLAAPWGLAQGFERYDAPEGSAGNPTAHMLERPARATIARACEWLRARDPSRPFFLWVHLFEPHDPYAPPAAFLERAGGDPYLGEVAALDDALGELMRVLDEEHGLERTLLVVAADHGEALGDHGERTHSVLCYEKVLRVPLFVREPSKRRAGERSGAPASVADVFPTFCAGLGLGAADAVDGANLLAALDQERGTYFESLSGYLSYGWSPIAGWVDRRGKYLHGTNPELYDLARDPAEGENQLGARTDDARRYRDALLALSERPRLERSSDAAVDEALRADVRALGYTGAGAGDAELPDPLDATGLPDARGRLDELERFYTAVLRQNDGKSTEAIALLEELVAVNPENVTALNVLATYLFQARRVEDALATLERIPARGRDRLNVQDLSGHCLEQLGRLAEAVTHFARALELKPLDRHQLEDLLRVHQRLGNAAEVERLRALLAE